MKFYDFLITCHQKDNIMARNPELGTIKKKMNGDIVWVDSGKIVGLTSDVRKADWTYMPQQPQQEVMQKMYKQDIIATVFLPDEKNPIYYKVEKPVYATYGDYKEDAPKPVFLKSTNKIHWERQSSLPIEEIVHGIWFSEAI